MKNTFQIKAFALARELGDQLHLSPVPLDSKNGIQFDNYLNLTLFTIYDDRLDKPNKSYVEVALGDYAINQEYGIAQDAALEWFQEFILQNAQEAKPKSPEFWRRAALRTEKQVSAFCSSLVDFLKNSPTTEVQNSKPDAQFQKNPAIEWAEQGEAAQKESPVDEITYRAIKSRRGQAEFRAALLATYSKTCCISNCEVLAVLEAAHIIPHTEETNYSVANGLLLRADIHTLYDLNLIGVDENGIVHISQSLGNTEYLQYQGVSIGAGMPKAMAENLGQRFALFKNGG